jgi:hypothetical protein
MKAVQQAGSALLAKGEAFFGVPRSGLLVTRRRTAPRIARQNAQGASE